MTSVTATRQRVSPERVLRGVPTLLVCLGVLLLFAVPASLLDLLGLGYGTPTGGALEKIHPGSDCLFLAFIVAAARAGNPFRYVATQARRFPCTAIFIGCIAFLTINLIKVQQAPFTPVIDTFLMPAILFVLLVDLPPWARVLIERGLHIFMAVNAVIGLVEFLSGWRLLPLTLNGMELTAEMEQRASGILGHPLASAGVGGMYVVILALGFSRQLPPWTRLPAVALQAVSLAAFGGRTALVFAYLSLVVVAVGWLGQVLAGRRFDKRALALAMLLAPVVAGGMAVLVGNGFFDLILSRFVEDNGSAQSRVVIFHLFSYLSWQEILFGPEPAHMLTVLQLEGLEVGIESFWLGFILLCGLFTATLFFLGFLLFVAEVLRRADGFAVVPFALFLIIISTTNSLATKSVSLGQFFVLTLILMPRRTGAAARPVAFVKRAWAGS